ncbi:MAG: hypothetical protein HYY06_28020 [Deltaproteobacteria bacterium]|nr:hypothetical protein [Deltaproteobacteria bacterium]
MEGTPRIVRTLVIVMLAVTVVACGRYSYRIQTAYGRGNYASAASRCQTDGMAQARWGESHRARYHVYCGMTYLSLGESERAAAELVQAEKMRQANPRLVRGRDLDQLNRGLMQLFGVPAGQLLIEEQSAVVASATVVAPPASPPAIEAPAPPAQPAPPAITISTTAPAAPLPPAAEDVVVAPAAPVPPAEAAPSTPVIVIPEQDAVIIE